MGDNYGFVDDETDINEEESTWRERAANIEENLFNNNGVEILKANTDSLLSFEDCPNHCTDGKIYDYIEKRFYTCKYCEEKRKKIASGRATEKNVDNKSEKKAEKEIDKDFFKIFNLPLNNVNNFEFRRNNIVPTEVADSMKKNELNKALDIMESLINNISIGEIPQRSYLFYLGANYYSQNFIVPFYTRAYIEGITLTPLLTTFDLANVIRKFRADNIEKYLNVTNYDYDDLLKKDIAVVKIESDSYLDDLRKVQGFMQLRAMKYNKPTIIFSHCTAKELKHMAINSIEEASYEIPYKVVVSFETEKKPESVNKQLQQKAKEQYNNIVKKTNSNTWK